MNLDLNPEQRMLHESVERFFRDDYTFEKRGAALASPARFDAKVWQRFAEFGWLAAPFSEEDAGIGGSMQEAAMVMEGIGRSLATEPYLPNVVLAGGLLAALGTVQQKASLLQPMMDGALMLALAFTEPQSRYRLSDCATSAERQDGGFVINGHKCVVLGGSCAQTFIVAARTAGAQLDRHGISLFVVPGDTPGVSVRPYPTIDGMSAADLVLQSVRLPQSALLGTLHEGLEPLEKSIDSGIVAIAFEAVGAMSALLELTLEYLKTRTQFGHPLGANQALQHRMVDMHIALEETRALAGHALHRLDEEPRLRRKAVSALKIQTGRASRLIGQEAVQMHGAMGVTAESPVSHYFKRLTMIDTVFGNVSWHEQQFGDTSDDLQSTRLRLSAEDERFSEEVREFIAANLPPDIAHKVENDQILLKDDYVRWQRILGHQGWLAYTWPAERGGPGWSIVRQYLFDTICSEMNCPPIIPFGTRMVGPVIQAFGTPAQQERFIGPILRSEEWWCQGYSEPMAGSDLAALRTRAEDCGDHYLVNGQKIWTSWAHYADWMFCLVRTSQHDRPQQGISFLLIDMKSPGVEVSPIVALDGTHSLNAVFLSDVRVPKENLIGEQGRGWTYAKYLLSHERLDNVSLGFAKRLLLKLKKIASEGIGGGMSLDQDPAFRQKMVDVEVRLMALDVRVLQMLGEISAGASPGPAVSGLKIRGTELCQRILELIMEAAGYHALPYQPSLILGQGDESPIGPAFAATAASRYLNRRAMSIFGGTTEVQKNIMAKAVLGLGG